MSTATPTAADPFPPPPDLLARDDWTVDEYLALPVRRLVEYVDGRLEFPPMPTETHQDVQTFLHDLLRDAVERTGRGKTVRSPFPIYVTATRYREPDVAVLFRENFHLRDGNRWYGADLVVEVLSPDNPRRDTVRMRAEYARAGIPEYWIADPRPRHRTITVLSLTGGHYRQHGECGEGQTADSPLLPGVMIDVAGCFAAGVP